MWFSLDNKEYFPLIRTCISPWWQRVFLFITALGGNVEAPWGPRCTMCCVLSTHLETYDTKCNGSLEDRSSAQKYFIKVFFFLQPNTSTIVGYLKNTLVLNNIRAFHLQLENGILDAKNVKINTNLIFASEKSAQEKRIQTPKINVTHLNFA